MKRNLVSGLVFVLVFGLAGIVNATLTGDRCPGGGCTETLFDLSITYNPAEVVTDDDSLTLSFDFGFSFESIESATLTLSLQDNEFLDLWGGEQVNLEYDGVAKTWTIWNWNYKDYSVDVYGDSLLDGAVEFVLSAGDGDSFKIKSAKLEVCGNQSAAPIPGAAWLLGSGLLGLLGLRRRFQP